ncbi:MAG: hypothetical protein L6Q77_13250 [Bacteroidetes bacterium]|nr:hypothetical protein [Bacteroidota bacterium]
MITSLSGKQIKFWSVTVVLSFLLQFLIPAGFVYAGSGPAKPEAAQFEPVDASDLVDLYTGDFTYNVPLIEVPGPEGNWPVNLSYHAGIGPNTEATWVGLGWTLNPGAINRFVSGYPDDYYAGGVVSTYYIPKQSGWGVGIGVGYGPFGMNMNFENGKGLTGWNASVSITQALGVKSDFNLGLSVGSDGAGLDIGYKTAMGNVGISAGTSGVGLSYSVGTEIGGGNSVGASIGINNHGVTNAGAGISHTYGTSDFSANSMSLMGVSWSNKQQGASFSFAGTGFQSISKGAMGEGHFSSSGFSIPIPLGNTGAWLSLSYWEWEWYLDEKHIERAFGSLHQEGYMKKTVSEYWGSNSENLLNSNSILNNQLIQNDPSLSSVVQSETATDVYYSTKYERNEIENVVDSDKSLLTSSEDIYQVAVQGLSGSFRPYFSNGYEFVDGSGTNENGQFKNFDANSANANTGAKIKFRFDADAGGNFISDTEIGFGSNNYKQIGTNKRGSRKIEPAIKKDTGKIMGFRIIAEDGKIYEFFQPVYSYYQYSETKVGSQTNTHTMSTPYATSWLITAVKGPDYVDLSYDGISADDYGFWVGFSYETSNLFLWRSPQNSGYDKVKDSEVFSTGMVDRTYLSKIFTASHKLEFNAQNQIINQQESINEFQISINEIGFSRSYDEGTDNDGIRDQYKYLDVYINKDLYGFVEYFIEKYSDFNPKIKVNGRNQYIYNGSPTQFEDFSQEIDLKSNINNLIYDHTSNLYKFETTSFSGVAGSCSVPICLARNTIITDCELILKRQTGNLIFDNVNKSLTSIELKNNNSQLIEKVIFNTSYKLQPGAENSTAGGKLTLNSIQKFGRDGITAIMPPTLFRYENNPVWDKQKYDYWNGYTSVGTLDYHFNSRDYAQATLDASAWNLSSISTPLGSKIGVDYESDEIEYVGEEYYIPNFTQMWAISKSSESNYLTTQMNVFAPIEINQKKGFIILEKMTGIYKCPRGWDTNFIFYKLIIVERDLSKPVSSDQINLVSPIELKGDITGPYYCISCFENHTGTTKYEYFLANNSKFVFGGHRVKSILITDFKTTKQTNYTYGPGVATVLPSEYRDRFDYSDSNLKKQIAKQLNPFFFDGGYNVLGQSASVGYEYTDVFEVNSADAMITGKTRTSFYTARDCGLDVTQTPEQVTIRDLSGMNGKIKSIEMFDNDLRPVKKDELLYRYSYSPTTVQDINGTTFNGTLLTDKIEGKDRSRKIRYNPGDGTATSDLAADQPLGLTQQRYISDSKGTKRKVEHVRENVYMVGSKSTTYLYDPVTHAPTGQTVTLTENIGFDALTGATLVTVTSDSKQNQQISENTPAYWMYPGMYNKNMLSQMAQNKNYLIPQDLDFWSLKDNNQASLDRNYLKSSSVTTWKNWEKGIWRQNDTYKLIKTGSTFEDFISWDSFNDEEANPVLGDRPPTQSASTDIWLRTSNITQYDRFSHPIEERSLDGNYTSSIYGYGGALPVAIASNARVSQAPLGADFSYFGAEPGVWENEHATNDYWTLYTTHGYNDLESMDARTGGYSVKIGKKTSAGGEATYGPTKDFRPSSAYQSGLFKVSAWVKTESGFGAAQTGALVIHTKANSTVNNWYPTANGTTPAVYARFGDTGGKWVYVEGIIDIGKIRQQANLTGSELLQLRVFPINENLAKTFLIDDIRVQPVKASLSTFAYDPVTWKVTAMTDENNITTFYEYDMAGRLVLVRDQDGNILNRTKYNYSKPTYKYTR